MEMKDYVTWWLKIDTPNLKIDGFLFWLDDLNKKQDWHIIEKYFAIFKVIFVVCHVIWCKALLSWTDRVFCGP